MEQPQTITLFIPQHGFRAGDHIGIKTYPVWWRRWLWWALKWFVPYQSRWNPHFKGFYRITDVGSDSITIQSDNGQCP